MLALLVTVTPMADPEEMIRLAGVVYFTTEPAVDDPDGVDARTVLVPVGSAFFATDEAAGAEDRNGNGVIDDVKVADAYSVME